MKRRSFLGALGATAFALSVPIEILEQVSHGTALNVALLRSEAVDAKVGASVLRFKGDLSKVTEYNVNPDGYEATASWEIPHAFAAWGIRVWGAEIAGEPWTKVAKFTNPARVRKGDILTVSYRIKP